MEFIQLKYFQAVARTGMIVTAAKNMLVTPPAISSAIAQLEQEMGTPLFSRVGNRLVLNQQGKILLKHADTILFNYGAAKAALLESLPEGTQHISVMVTESHLWSNMIAAFAVKYPHYTITLNSTTHGGLAKGAFKPRYAILMATENSISPELAEECDRVRLFQDYPAIMVSKAHPMANRESVSLADLQGHPLIHPKSYPDYIAEISRQFENSGLPIPQIRTYSHMVCQALALKNDAIALTTVHSQIACTDKFAYIPINGFEKSWSTYLCWRKSRKLSVPEKTLIDFISDFY